MPLGHQGAEVRLLRRPHGIRRKGLHTAHVAAGAKGAPLAGDHNHPHPRVRLSSIDAPIELGAHRVAPRIHPLGPIKGDYGNAGLARVV